ncbi:MAG: MmgE/PrpD family protein [Theionarchaea archaeon]|nr:MmgE/PrpD family protein [Theionarchaea archaeon]MBU7036953.1 MmgE/PrpD family protein [Theionarchaea archaeon]
MESISQKMAQFALRLEYKDIPPEAVKEAKRFLLDSIGCALAACHNEDMDNAVQYITNLGGHPQSTIIGYGHKTNMPNAALMNSLLIRALDYNDIYWKQDPSHPSDIIPAALCPGEYRHCSGKELITSIVIAYELEMRLCLAAHPGVREVGWHHATLTQFVSPIVAGVSLGLTEEQIVAAVGISGSSHSTFGGVVAGALTNMKNTADPMATEAGVRAAMLAQTGYTGPVHVYEGKEGLFQVINNVKWDESILTEHLGTDFLITQCEYKAFPTEALTHQPITAVLTLMEENTVDPHQVTEILVETTTRGADILSDPSKYNPTTKETADHSLPYCIAVAAAKGNVLPSDFEEQALFDPLVRELIKKVKVVANPEIDSLFPKIKRAVCSITTKEGKTYTRQEDFARGSTGYPMTDQELVSKFKANSGTQMSESRLEKITDATFNCEKFTDITDYMEILVSDL